LLHNPRSGVIALRIGGAGFLVMRRYSQLRISKEKEVRLQNVE